MYNPDPDIGSLSNILYSEGLCFVGSEVDMSIRPGWFYHPEEAPHSLERLFATYLASVGSNACFHLNIPPTPEGLFDQRDVQRLRELGGRIRSAFQRDLAEEAAVTAETLDSQTQAAWVVRFPSPQKVHYLTLMEDIAQGQRVESFVIQARNDFGQWSPIYHGTTIGHKKICVLDEKPYDELRVFVTSARDQVLLRRLAIY